MKLTKQPKYILAVVIAIAVIAIAVMASYKKKSTYILSPEPIKITGKDGDIFSLPTDIKCLPNSYYTKDLTPGGICGDQEFVRSQAEDYKIVDGIGGSLLDQ